ncbi:MAG: hypothetical protein WBQ23_04845 [Bacteroidota bacterium]
MNIRNSLFGPPSKYDHSLPYTYVARVQTISGEQDLVSAYFADTICGLIDCLEANTIDAGGVELFGLFVDREISLDVRYCVDVNGHWLGRPEICHSLESRFKETLEMEYRGHREEEPCSYVDRSRMAHGPY